MAAFTFELEPFRDDSIDGLRGIVGPFGEATVHYILPSSGNNVSARTELRGENLPHAQYTGPGVGQPSLYQGMLEVAGSPVDLVFNVRGIRTRSRWLQLAYGDREYTYKWVGKKAELRRDDVKVAIGPGRHIRKIGLVSAGEVEGTADAVDLAIAIIFERVDTDVLTLGGAIMSAPFNFLNRLSRLPDGGSV